MSQKIRKWNTRRKNFNKIVQYNIYCRNVHKGKGGDDRENAQPILDKRGNFLQSNNEKKNICLKTNVSHSISKFWEHIFVWKVKNRL